jgi:RHS repeat-associated protein
VFNYANVGYLWNFDWLRFLQEESTDYGAPHVWVHLTGGGMEWYADPNSDGAYDAGWRSRSTVVRTSTSPLRYERRLPDGTVEVYAQPDNGSASRKRVFLTQIVDPQGQALTFTWDASFRLVAVTDAIGQVTTLSYDLATDPLKLTKVTDPFGRFAVLTYTAAGQLASITDVVGITSSFTYETGDFIAMMTTPYGQTVFRHEDNWIYAAYNDRMVEATDPLGGTEHMEFHWYSSAIPATAPASEVPTGFAASNTTLGHSNTFYWDKLAWQRAPGDLTQATITKWMWKPYIATGPHMATDAPHSTKRPLEGRVWYTYPGQLGATDLAWLMQPAKVGRSLENGTSQISEWTYDTFGNVLMATDPVGRRTSYTYAANGLDLLTVRQTTGSMNDLLASFSSYTAQHRPQISVDAAGQTTTTTYNAAGQPLTITNPKLETTTLAYDTNGQTVTTTGPVAGAQWTYTYDSYGRVRTVTDPDGYTVTTDYDALNRVTTRTYPDGTYEASTYDRLDLGTQRDRLGRLTRYYYDAVRRLVGTRDPLGRTVRQDWCTCGSLEKLVDGMGQTTTWERDLEGRVTREIRADGVTDTLYTYDTSGRLKTVTDPKDQVTTHTYLADDRVASTIYTNAVVATPGVSYTYEAAYPRVATMVDGTGTTTYSYQAPGVLGAGQVATVDGPLANDVIAYSYDPLGRVTTRTINGAANSVTSAFDALGRVTSEANVLGAFTYGYDGVTSRVASVAYPNGQTSAYSYLPNSGDHRLLTIHHRYPSQATLSKFDYTYDTVGNITTWRQQAESTATVWAYGYDGADQLTRADQWSTAAMPAIVKRYAYGYDPAGNRTTEQTDNAVMGATYSGLNRLVSQQPAGMLQVAGQLNEPGTVTIGGQPALLDANNRFTGTTVVTPGANAFTVTATDASGNTAQRTYDVTSSGTPKSFTYDANGNLTADGSRTFEWDARNQLVAVTVGTHRSEFTYDGSQRRVRMVEKENGVVLSDTKVLWCQTEICEERAADGTTVTRRSFTQGEQVAGVARFFTTDHLGSVAEVTNASVTLLARYAFDPFGRRTVTAGTDVTSVGFTGHRMHTSSGLALTLYRGYDAELGRWATMDPVGSGDGPNVYAYVQNQPTKLADSLGLLAYKPGVPLASPPLASVLSCIESCIGRELTVTATTDSHPPGSPHGRGNAADLRWIPGGGKKLLCCAAKCGAKFGLDEGVNPSSASTGPHFHIQTTPGLNGGRGDLPCQNCG